MTCSERSLPCSCHQVGAQSLTQRNCDVWNIVAHLAQHLAPLFTTIPARNKTPHPSVPVMDGLIHHITFPHTICSQTLPPLILYAYIYALFPAPFTSPYRWRQQGPLKWWYPTTTLHSVTTQKTSTWTTGVSNKSQRHTPKESESKQTS